MPHDHPVSRRRALGAIAGGAAATLWLGAGVDPRALAAAGAHAAAAMRQTPRPPFQVLTAEQAADIEAITSRIIPSDDGTPGAREAGVVYFVDKALAGHAKKEKESVEKRLAEIRAEVAKRNRGVKSFAALDAKKQDAVIAALQKADAPAFWMFRQITTDGMFSNPEYGGNQGEVGWRLLGFANRASWQAPFGYYDRDA
jgi:gluconate 2-dehydrogenase gamma chain